MFEEVAENLGVEVEVVDSVVSEFALQLHRRALEHRGFNGDYIGEELRFEIGNQAFYHLLGFLTYFAGRYTWDEGVANEYLMRLGSRADWLPFRHQMAGWQITDSPSRYLATDEIQPETAELNAECPICGAPEFNPNSLTTVREFYSSSHEWVQLKNCYGCNQAFFLYGFELCRLSGSHGEDEIYTYAAPVSSEDLSDLETVDWRKDMLSWENNAAKRVIMTRQRRVIDPSGRCYWSDADNEFGFSVIPPG